MFGPFDGFEGAFFVFSFIGFFHNHHFQLRLLSTNDF